MYNNIIYCLRIHYIGRNTKYVCTCVCNEEKKPTSTHERFKCHLNGLFKYSLEKRC